MNRILSGIRPTGQLHLGNYLGAVRQFVNLAQDPDNECLFFIANLHGLTTGTSREAATEMREDILGIVIDYLAAGLDPDASNVTIYAQSSVPETAELTWILQCVTPLGELLGMHHFADKRDKMTGAGESVNAGLLGYPVLMAADILGPCANIVPVGDDQREHVELARRTARRVNDRFEEDFCPVPATLHGPGIRVPGLKGSGKMGKSEPKGTINLVDTTEEVERKVKKADKMLPPVVGSGVDPVEPRIGDEPGNPHLCRVFRLHDHLASGESDPVIAEIHAGCESGTLRCGDCKVLLARRVNELLDPIRARRAELLASRGRDLAMEILVEHGRRARALIAPKVEMAKELAGVPSYFFGGGL